MSAGGLLLGARAALDGLGVALGVADVRKAYAGMVGVFFLATSIFYFGLGWGGWMLADRFADGFWLPLLRAGVLLIVLLVSPVVALFLVQALLPVLSERLFLASVRAVRAPLAEELEACEGLTVAQTVGISLRRLARYLGLAALVFLFSLVPIVGPLLGPPLALLLTARTLGGEVLDPYMALRGMRWAEQRAFLSAHRSPVVGFALPFVALLAIPFVGALLFGVAQAAAGVLVARHLEPAAAPVAAPETAPGADEASP